RTAFGFFIALFLARMILIAVGASFYEPICRFVYQLTNPVITPLRRFVPRWRRIELASLLVAFALVLIEFGLFALIAGASIGGVRVRRRVDSRDWLIWIGVTPTSVPSVLGFVVSDSHTPKMHLLVQCTAPVGRPFRRILPPLGGLDFSLGFASIALVLAQMLVV